MSGVVIFEVTVDMSVVENGEATHSAQVTTLVSVPVSEDDDEYDRDLMRYYEAAKQRAFDLLAPFGNNRVHIDPLTAALRYIDESLTTTGAP